MPKGLRRPLYVKDEDFKHSFLNGNYVTLTSASPEDLRRIASIGLSPLFVSVHATDPRVRAALLGNKRIPDVREQLSFLRGNGIAFHTQIVLCPGLNDGEVLKRTVGDLLGYGDSLMSIAVVPVGLTRFRKRPLTPVDKSAALAVCDSMGRLSESAKSLCGVRKLFVADEFFIKAGLPIPPVSYYEDYPQIENGVGLVRQLLREGARLGRAPRLKRPAPPQGRTLVITGQSALPFVEKALSAAARRAGKTFDVRPVPNRYFGETVTVAGLLTARDVVREVKRLSTGAKYAEIILPGVMFNHAGYTLDGYSPLRVSKLVGLPVRTAGTIEEAVCAGK
jgi:putative radical SAM enzyme (TIGR03279 family)